MMKEENLVPSCDSLNEGTIPFSIHLVLYSQFYFFILRDWKLYPHITIAVALLSSKYGIWQTLSN